MALVALGASSVAGGAAATTQMVFGYGSETCGSYLESTQPKGNALSASVAVSWVQGYITRAGDAHSYTLAPDLDAASLKGWLANYCTAQPLDTLQDAGAALEEELARRNAPPEPKPKAGQPTSRSGHRAHRD
jgi:hypothetical protein